MSQEKLDAMLPPIAGDRSTVYMGLVTVRNQTRVLFVRENGEEGVLPHAGTGTPALDGTFEWGEAAGAVGLLLATALLAHALGAEAAKRHREAFRAEVVAILPADDWELSARRIEQWVVRRMTVGGAS